MIINVMCLLVFVARGYCHCQENLPSPVFFISESTFQESKQDPGIKISSGTICSGKDTNHKNSTSNLIPSELVKLSLCYDSNRISGFIEAFLDVTVKSPVKTLSILFTMINQGQQSQFCMEVNLTKNVEDIFTVVFIEIHNMQMEITGREGNKVYHQNLFIFNNKTADGQRRRFVYADTTTNKGYHTIHIAKVHEDVPTTYSILRKNLKSTKSEIIWKTYDSGEVTHKVPASDKNWYIVEESPRTYHNETVASAFGIALLFLAAITAVVWYASKPKQRVIVVIYCQCEQHKFYSDGVAKLLRFLEQDCMITLEAPSSVSSNPGTPEDEILLDGRSKSIDFVVFIPFPNVADHDRSYESEAHQFCERYQSSRNKVELNFHFAISDFDVIRSDWPKRSYKSFQFLEDLPKFIRYIHPFYFPSFLERFIRPKLWGPRLKRILEKNTFTNDYFREITDPKYQVKTVSHSLQVDPNLVLNAFI